MENVTGIMVYYYSVCKRKLWYFGNEITMEQNNENVSIGCALDDLAYSREDKHINIDNVINIDFISSDRKLHEIKKSRKIESASEMQMKYYLYYLYTKGVIDITAELDYPLLKQTHEIFLTSEDIAVFSEICSDIKEIITADTPPLAIKMKFCKSCAYYDLCFL